MPNPTASTTPVLKADRRLEQRAATIRRDLEEADSTCASLADRSAGADLRKRCAAALKSLAALDKELDAKQAGRQLDLIQKRAGTLHDQACTLEVAPLAVADWRAANARAQALLKAVQAQLSAIRHASAAEALVRERDALRDVLAGADRQADYGGRMAVYRTVVPKLEALESRAAVVARFAEWYDGAYVRLHERAQADIRRCPAERCRRTLEAEVVLIGEAAKKKLAASDLRGVEAAGVRPLQQLMRVAGRVTAASPALDRELLRIGQRLAQFGAPPAETAELRKLVQHKKSAWPDAADPDGLERAMRAFETAVGALATRVEQLPAARVVDTAG